MPKRLVIDLPEGMIAYSLVPPLSHHDAAPCGTEEYVVSLSFFRRWIRKTGATLTEQMAAKVAPAIELAKKVATLRRAHGMSQVDLAKAVGLSRSAIAALETGRTSNANKHLPKLAKLFQVPTELFLGGMVEHNSIIELSSDERDLIDLYRLLPTEQKLNVQKYAERRARG
ncbi:helix-turn-helix transcriptional regulator [Gluconobacter kondonii]|uniref:helix-turn-helix domain-containing protein n=1 Tax=Gluconobacter TaxID=441 RepID=UPI0020A0A974|nr:helix-turn-helix transcriptional regulator [Gluconobacter kondonii]MCP1237985.1 helix-turn-helix transcriptional regulator [Gluconobacter kondonii]